MKNILFTFIIIITLSAAYSKTPILLKRDIIWQEQSYTYSPIPNYEIEIYSFDGANYESSHPTLPYFTTRFPVEGYGRLSVELINTIYVPLKKSLSKDDKFLHSDLKFITSTVKDRSNFFGELKFIPIRKTATGQFEKLISFELKISFTPSPNFTLRGENTFNSVLSTGSTYKVGISKNGIHKMDYNFLKNELKIPIDEVDVKKIKIYGNGAGMLPEKISTPRIDDLFENAIKVVDTNNDGKFNSSDYILFYAEESGKWTFNNSSKLFTYKKNIYSNLNYYFIKIDGENGKRLATRNSLNTTSNTSNSFNDYIHFEEDKVNLLHPPPNQGSGKRWFGDHFEALREKNYNNIFSFPNLIQSEPISFHVEFAGRSDVNTKFKTIINGQPFTSNSIAKTITSKSDAIYAHIQKINKSFNSSSDQIELKIEYPLASTASQGWLDFIEMNARRALQINNNQLFFRDINSLQNASTNFEITGASNNILVWDITNPRVAITQETNLSGNTLSFGTNTESLKEFIAFNQNGPFLIPEKIGEISAQNIHGIDNVDMVIVYPKDFESQAEQLANHRRGFSQLEVATVLIDEIYNEFSSGALDPSALRDFAKMLHDRNSKFKYLLLFGDGSYDFKDINKENEKTSGFNHNRIVVYETANSLDPINSFPSDDYFALLSDNEGNGLNGALDIAIGRLPVRSIEEAQIAIDKIISYNSNKKSLGDWRNRIAFVADDEDSNQHFSDADNIAKDLSSRSKIFNIDKIYFDAFQQESTSGGEKYPAVSDAINANMFKGLLCINYLGHGGWKGWAQERVLNANHIRSWNNYEKMPLVITATCSFSGYDEPRLTTGGEEAFLNEKGGAIALFSTVRAVYAHANFTLTKAVFDTIFQQVNSEYATIGEVLRVAKNVSGASTQNSRKFTLLGDPAMKLALPKYGVQTSKINGSIVSINQLDTIKALQKVTIEGSIIDESGSIINNFNGKIFPTIYDKVLTLKTLGQDRGSRAAPFQIQKNILFKGVASVTNGHFKFSFVVPKDIDFAFGNGKISYYASNENNEDAAGYFENIIIGGTDNTALADETGPEIEVFMNDSTFAFGGITDKNPVLFVKLSDKNGINVIGNSIGHDLTGILDNNTQNTYQLNDFYESELDDFTKGIVRFPLFNLETGRHQIKVRAWDVANNESEAYTEFIVAKSAELSLEHVLNYPNPFTTNTNFQFEHNFANQLLDVQVRIFTVSGSLVKTIENQILSNGYRVTDMSWDGTDDFGDRLGRGVYLYKVKVGLAATEGSKLSSESEFEKLVILK